MAAATFHKIRQELISVSGPALLQQAAVDAAKRWRFSNPLNAPVTVQLTLAFTLTADSETESQTKARGLLKNTHKVDAVYPEEAKRRGIQGEVAVEIKVNTVGEVTDARAVSGNEGLRQAAVDAAKRFRFSNELNAPVTAGLTFNFVLGK